MKLGSLLDRAKIAAEIAKIGSEVYAVIVDKSREARDREARIRELEAERDALKDRLERGSR